MSIIMHVHHVFRTSRENNQLTMFMDDCKDTIMFLCYHFFDS